MRISDAPSADDHALEGVFRVPLRAERRQIPVEVVRVHYLPVRRPVRLGSTCMTRMTQVTAVDILRNATPTWHIGMSCQAHHMMDGLSGSDARRERQLGNLAVQKAP